MAESRTIANQVILSYFLCIIFEILVMPHISDKNCFVVQASRVMR